MRELLRTADVMVAPSRFVKEKYVEFGLEKRRILVIPPGVDVKAIKRSHKPVHSDKLRFGYLGGNSETRGVSIVLDAFSRIADDTVELVIAGLHTQRSLFPLTLPRQAKLVGAYLPDNLGEVLSKMDVLVVPSRCHESYNLVVREAFAAKIPVIVSDLRAQSDAIQEGIDGFHFKAGDTADLASKMRLLKDNRISLERLRDGIPNVPEVNRQTAKIEKVLRELVSRRKTALRRRQEADSARLRSYYSWYVESLAERTIGNLRVKLSLRAEEATRLKNELDEIKRSVGYRFVRFYGSRFDQLFPDDTRRGDLRRKITQRLRSLLKTA